MRFRWSEKTTHCRNSWNHLYRKTKGNCKNCKEKRKKRKVEPLISCEKNQKITKTDWDRRWSKRFTFAELSWMFLQYILAMCLYMLYICFFPHWKTINSQESICQQLLLLIFKSLHSALISTLLSTHLFFCLTFSTWNTMDNRWKLMRIKIVVRVFKSRHRVNSTNKRGQLSK